MYIKNKTRDYLRNSLWALKINAFLHRFSAKRNKQEMERRAAQDIFDYKAISKPVADIYLDYIPENNFYGMSYMIKRIVGESAKLKINGFFEHGLFFGNYIAKQSYLYGFDRIFTFGKFRYEVLSQSPFFKGKSIIEIGPYIAYAKNLLTKEEFKTKKQKLGKTLLVFPTHSSKGVTMDFNNDDLVKEIERLRVQKHFDSVMISLYYRDISDKPELVNHYESMGYKIVCSGDRSDIHFLDRQRTIIELSDMTMSNEAGTHIGYCIYLNKPHYVYSQEVSFREDLEEVLKHEGMSDDVNKSQNEHRTYVESFFSEYSETISERQRDVVDYYWGISQVKNVDEIRNCFI